MTEVKTAKMLIYLKIFCDYLNANCKHKTARQSNNSHYMSCIYTVTAPKQRNYDFFMHISHSLVATCLVFSKVFFPICKLGDTVLHCGPFILAFVMKWKLIMAIHSSGVFTWFRTCLRAVSAPYVGRWLWACTLRFCMALTSKSCTSHKTRLRSYILHTMNAGQVIIGPLLFCHPS